MPGNTSRSFVVRIWIEPREYPNATVEWRGMIEDVISGERKYFKNFDDMIAFLTFALSIVVQETKRPEQ
jgi:hypothetical protein